MLKVFDLLVNGAAALFVKIPAPFPTVKIISLSADFFLQYLDSYRNSTDFVLFRLKPLIGFYAVYQKTPGEQNT